MTQIEKIKAEKIDHLLHILFNLIAERILKCPKCGYPYKEGYICDNCGADNSDNEEEYPLDELIDTMQAEPVSEDLELASERYACKFSSSKYGHDKVKDAVVWGANWQKEQMMKDAVEGSVSYRVGEYGEVRTTINYKLPKEYNCGDKVKLIIVKED